jgi:hypothetical protein
MELLATVDSENKEYIEEFNNIMNSERLTIPKIENYSQTVIGQLLEEFLGYKIALRLKKFFGTEICKENTELDNRILKAGNLSGKYSLSIVSNREIKVFQEEHDIPVESYVLSDMIYKYNKRNGERIFKEEKKMPDRWVKVPAGFLNKTYALLKEEDKTRFVVLKKT